MSGRRPNPSTATPPPAKKSRKAITLEMKLDVLSRYEQGHTTANIQRATNLSESTLRTIRDNREKIRNSAKAGCSLKSARQSYVRHEIMDRMEKLLAIWIQDQNRKKVPMSMAVCQEKARKIYASLAVEEPNGAAAFGASSGWFSRFKARHGFHNIKLSGERASADDHAADTFKEELKKIIEDGQYSNNRIFNADETALYIKKMFKSTYIAKEETRAPGYKASKTRVTLMLGANLSGHHKLKPLLIHQFESPRALQGLDKASLPVRFYTQENAWMNSSIFRSWITKDLERELKVYCQAINEPFKVLLLLDNFKGHDKRIVTVSKNIKIVFLPANTTPLIQPMDQNVIATFKAKYLRNTLHAMLTHVDNSPHDIKHFWSQFNLYDSIKHIATAWKDISVATLKAAWRNLCPHLTTDLGGFDVSAEVSEVREEIENQARQLNFDQVNEREIKELLDTNDELSVDELREMDRQQQAAEVEAAEMAAAEEAAETAEAANHEITPTLSLTSKSLTNIMNIVDHLVETISQADPNTQRSAKVARITREAYHCYQEILSEKKRKLKQPNISTFFTPIQPNDPSGPQSGPSSRLEPTWEPQPGPSCRPDSVTSLHCESSSDSFDVPFSPSPNNSPDPVTSFNYEISSDSLVLQLSPSPNNSPDPVTSFDYECSSDSLVLRISPSPNNSPPNSPVLQRKSSKLRMPPAPKIKLFETTITSSPIKSLQLVTVYDSDDSADVDDPTPLLQ